MEFILFLAMLAGIVWLGVALKYFLQKSVNPIPVGATVLIVVASVFGADFFSIDAVIPITFDRLLLCGLAAMFALLVLFGYDQIRPLNRTDVLVFGLLVWIMMSTFSHDWTTRNNLPMSRLLFFNFLPAILYAIVRNARIETKDLKTISIILGVFGFYLALTGICEVRGLTSFVFPAYISDISVEEFFGRARGPFLNPVSNGTFLIVCLASLLMWWKQPSVGFKLILWLAIPIFTYAIYATYTRSVWLSLAIAVAVVVFLVVPQRLRGRIVFLGAVCGLLTLIVAGQSFVQFKRDEFVSETDMKRSAELRPLFAIVAFRMFQDRPVLGHGFGQYTSAKTSYLQDATGNYQLALTKPYMQHNLFLNYLTELGLFGFTILILLLFNLAAMAVSIWKNQRRHLFARYFGLLALVLLTCHVTNGMFHDVSIAPMANMFLYFIAGLVTNLYTAVPATTVSADEFSDAETKSLARSPQYRVPSTY